MKTKSGTKNLKARLFIWIADKIHDDLVSNGFVHENDFTNYFDSEIDGNNYVSDYDMSQAIDNVTEDFENSTYEIEDNIQDIHTRLERVEEFLKKKYPFGGENGDEGY